jgi:murein DD-endopeptidase MepM/ murein hydrolase activator NlpD
MAIANILSMHYACRMLSPSIRLMAIVVFFACTSVHAAEAPIVVASAANAPRFYPLAGARSGQPGVRVQAPLRSDRLAMENGFMRLDRARLNTVSQQPRVVRPTAQAKEEAVRVTRPQDNAVLDLFGESIPSQPRQLGSVAHAWPLPSAVTQHFTSGFGGRADPFTGKAGFHGGVDIAAAVGTPVLASADGIVTKVETGARYGKYVSIQHADGTESSYGHMSGQNVRVGQRVRQGQQVGALGSTGRSTGPHLDYRIRKNGALFNPMTVLRQPSGGGNRAVAANTRTRTTASTINGVKIIR